LADIGKWNFVFGDDDEINDLFKKTIGLEEISVDWYWAGRRRDSAESSLDDLITLRGSIAHRVTTSSSVTLKHVTDSRELINRLAVKSHNSVCTYLGEKLEKSPWHRLVYKATW